MTSFATLLFPLLLHGGWGATDPQDAEAARSVVVELGRALERATQETERGGWTAGRSVLEPALRATHDFDRIAAACVGEAWSTWSAAERDLLVSALVDFAAATYAARLEAGALRVGSARTLGEGGVAVESIFQRADDDLLPLEFRLEESADGWRITDVVAGDEAGVARLRREVLAPLDRADAGTLAARLAEPVSWYAESPTEVVTRLQEGILEIMKRAAELGFEERFARFGRLIPVTHELPTVAKLTLRSSWRSLDPSQREAFVHTFRELSVATYTSRFDGYSGERFEIRDEKKVSRGGVLVKGFLVKATGERVSFDYMLRRSEGRWQIINIVADGVSDLALKRAEYESVIERDGFDALLEKLRAQVNAYRSGGED